MFTRFIFGIVVAGLAFSTASAQEADADQRKVSVVFDRALPNAPGMSMKGVLVEYGPGAASPAHTHPASAFIYATVLEGAVRIKVNDEPEKIYRAGENFVEMPGDHHGVSANASDTEPSRLLAVFVVKTDETKLVTEDK
ncbi:cupin domain-containing protein [Dongia sp.]|uniref:cupin domain-containing protein n=1 Tax=Dongia sp. TaxID=1977262 RepID=UPI0035B2A79E